MQHAVSFAGDMRQGNADKESQMIQKEVRLWNRFR